MKVAWKKALEWAKYSQNPPEDFYCDCTHIMSVEDDGTQLCDINKYNIDGCPWTKLGGKICKSYDPKKTDWNEIEQLYEDAYNEHKKYRRIIL